MDKIDFLEEMANFTFTSKYARYDEKLKRRETWHECVARVEKMHLERYSFLSKGDQEEIQWAFNLVRDKFIVGSMRSMQFGGKAVEAHNAKIFNCAVRHMDSSRAFAEVFYLCLCGCGIGCGITKDFLHRLPNLVNSSDKNGVIVTYQILDTIEGWADSLQALLQCYFKNNAFTGRKIVFDYSRIRRKGSKLKTGGGKAPGYKPLKEAHVKIKRLLDSLIEDLNLPRLRAIDVCDIICHAADSVLSGGIRRSALAMIFDRDDKLMMEAKIGDWFKDNPQRARSNNSFLLYRDKITLAEFSEMVEFTKQWGEPGFVFTDSSVQGQLYNPCQPSWAPILTKNGVAKLSSINIGDEIWSASGWTKVVNKGSTGVKKVYEYRTTAGIFYGTENHKLVSNGIKTEARDAESIDIISGEYTSDLILNQQDVLDGLVIGDGSVIKSNNNCVNLNIGVNDQDYFNSETGGLILHCSDNHRGVLFHVKTTITPSELPLTFNRTVPDRFYYGDKGKVAGFLRGLYSANGSICGTRITLKAASFKLIEQVQIMLSGIGIRSYYTTNKPSKIQWANGEYTSKESYDLNISSDRDKFWSIIGFIQKYKTEKLYNILNKEKSKYAHTTTKSNYQIIETNLISEEEVFDLTVDNDSHTYWTGGVNVSNCFEIGFIPTTNDGVSGVQFCNLSSINGGKTTSLEIFKEQAKAAALIGTLQAGYTDFAYLSHIAKELTEEESLLGVSITGIMDNPEILLNARYQKIAAEIAVETNEIWAKKININPAARVTCVKPEGTSSLILMASSGIHPHHANQYFRRIQCNKTDNVYKFFKKQNNHACEESVWSATNSDDMVTFPVSIDNGALVKKDLTAIKHLEYVKKTQENWVLSGTGKTNKKQIFHNVSCTVLVGEDEWDEVVQYLFENRQYFSAVSLLSRTGDKNYKQAPMEEITIEKDKEKFESLKSNWKKIDYTQLIEDHDETELTGAVACGGGACEIT